MIIYFCPFAPDQESFDFISALGLLLWVSVQGARSSAVVYSVHSQHGTERKVGRHADLLPRRRRHQRSILWNTPEHNMRQLVPLKLEKKLRKLRKRGNRPRPRCVQRNRMHSVVMFTERHKCAFCKEFMRKGTKQRRKNSWWKKDVKSGVMKIFPWDWTLRWKP